jgi:adenylate cyclase
VHAAVVDYLKAAGARAVVFDVQFSEPDAAHPGADAELADALAGAGNGVLPVALAPLGAADDSAVVGAATGEGELPRFALPGRPALALPDLGSAITPLPELAHSAAAVGSIALNTDRLEGVVRRERLLWRHQGRLYPSLAFATARLIDPARFGGPVAGGEGELRAGRTRVPLYEGQMLLRWRGRFENGTRHTYPAYSYSRLVLSYEDVAAGRPPAVADSLLRGKVVFVGVTASGLLDLRDTPLGGAEPGVMIHVTALDNLLRGDFLRRAPAWANTGLALAAALAGALAVAAIASAAWSTLAAVLVLLLVASAGTLAFRNGIWLDVAAPTLAVALAYSGAMATSYVTEGRERRRVRDMFSRYVDPDMVRELADEGGELSLEGKRVPLTILFSDIRGFTSLSEKLPAETVVEMLNEYLGAMVEVVWKHGGTLDKFIGDAVMAFWGAPRAVPDHARRAAECALDMMTELEHMNARWQSAGRDAELRIGIGINTGEAVVGNIGSLKHKLDYTVIGDTVNLASRLESMNKELNTTIIISHSTCVAMGDAYQATPLPDVHVKGKEQAVKIHELRGRAPARVTAGTRAAVAVAGVLLCLLPAAGHAQKTRWTDRIYQPGRWQGGQVVPLQTTDAATEALAQLAVVSGYGKAPKWRVEIQKVAGNGALGEALVLVGDKDRVVVVTPVGTTPLAQHAANSDPIVQAVVARFDPATGTLRQAAAVRSVQRSGGFVSRVYVHQPNPNGDFSDELLATSRGRRGLGALVNVAQNRLTSNNTASSTANTAGARGVRDVDTPSGRIQVNPDPAAVAAMERRPVNAVAVDAFLREGHLVVPVPVVEETTT